MFRLADFLIYCFITAYTPGPNNILSMNYAAKYGFNKSFRFNLGIAVGFFIVMTACAVFTSALSSIIPKIEYVLQLLGAAYMICLAYKTYKSSNDHNIEGKHGSTFASGLILQFMNVKIYIYAITAMSLYVLPVYDSFLVISFFILILTLIGASGNFVWALFGNAISSFTAKHNKAVNAVMALLLIYCAIAFFL